MGGTKLWVLRYRNIQAGQEGIYTFLLPGLLLCSLSGSELFPPGFEVVLGVKGGGRLGLIMIEGGSGGHRRRCSGAWR